MTCNTWQRSSTRYAMALGRRTRSRLVARRSGAQTQSQRPGHERPSPRAARAPKGERRRAQAAYARLVGPWRLRVESDAEGFPRTRCLFYTAGSSSMTSVEWPCTPNIHALRLGCFVFPAYASTSRGMWSDACSSSPE